MEENIQERLKMISLKVLMIESNKIKRFNTKTKKFKSINLEIGFGAGENLFAQSQNNSDLFQVAIHF